MYFVKLPVAIVKLKLDFPLYLATTTPDFGHPEFNSRRQAYLGPVLISTGTSPNRPAEVPFDTSTVFDSDTILTLPRIPGSMIVLGGGVIAIEYAIY